MRSHQPSRLRAPPPFLQRACACLRCTRVGLVDGVYFNSNEGEATDCNAAPEGCSELISNAVDGGGETTTSADPPPGSRPAPESLPGGAPDYHYEFQRQRDGTLLFSLDRRVRGLWGYCAEPRLCD